HLDCATNLNPKFVEAIELKQKITGKEVTSVDTSSIRGFVRDMIMQDRDGAAVPPPTKTGDDKNKAAGNSTASIEEPLDDDEAMTENDPEALPADQTPDGEDDWDDDDDAAGGKSATTQSATQPASSQPTS